MNFQISEKAHAAADSEGSDTQIELGEKQAQVHFATRRSRKEQLRLSCPTTDHFAVFTFSSLPL